MNNMKQSEYSGKARLFMLALIALIIMSGGLIYAITNAQNKIDFENKNDLKMSIGNFSNKNIDKEADRLLKSMSDFLENTQDFSFHSNGYFEYIIDSLDQKIQVSNESNTDV